ncbi:MAG: tRNA uridine-5-carboxymethylaminomethyl(34) synthesis GTPase MnmE [Gemmatimonadota bacterium]|nr:tRNA uridine-5-carboxymethylaminomethyl(34) synthesis GTPase MnmE [Gemmatimonadota bacterium]
MGAPPRPADPRGDTIVATATAPGRGALAVIRVSGPDAHSIARRCTIPWPTTARQVTRVRLHAPARPDTPLDEAMITWFAAPRSFTGEDLVEYTVHGGAFVPAAVLAALVAAGARPALPGEFTERAVRNGKLDLLRAEAIGDLIDARTAASHRLALRQLDGVLTRHLAALRDAVLGAEALIAYDLDFPSEDDGPLDPTRVLAAVDATLTALDTLLATLPQAALGRDGVMVVLAGAPNAGKSSLFNALVGESRALVSEVPGTTRDAIEVLLDDDPWPIRLVDTAGLRSSDDRVERLGIEVSHRRLAEAQVVLVCGEDDASLARGVVEVRAHSAAPLVRVRTKGDRATDTRPAAIDAREVSEPMASRPIGSQPIASPRASTAVDDVPITVSVVTGNGLAALRNALRATVRATTPDPAESAPVVTRARHVAALTTARAELQAFRGAWAEGALPVPVAATHLRAATLALDELLGAFDVEEVLDRVFRAFCIGK